ncbi:membrane protein [Devosia limi DSM 17137]|uniref:Membrane protein n=1 Tax=Devosia limi DSM 17137 TaxID=1121477 RepID=A0A0F5LWQ0_9HYPH|nr:DUF2177 family protein [Devosia limi]KKB86721.1 membrane protein [Devosia limi DSM 17137]SHF66630.1 Uncharacterized membrane protein [Devosia limi DSM 17137]
MTKYLILYAACALIFFPLDFIWLSTMGKGFYQRELGGLLLERPNLAIAGLFYLAYLVGVVALVAAPAEGDVMRALLMGAVLGFVAYGTYDLTNLSTVKGFTPMVAVVDMAWGTALTAATAAGGVWISRFFA